MEPYICINGSKAKQKTLILIFRKH